MTMIIRRFTESDAEAAAQVVADAVLDEYPLIEKVKVLLKKPEAPINADFEYVAVEIERARK